jgi:hypothetical protein
LFFSISANSSAGCSNFTNDLQPTAEYFTLGYTTQDFFINPVGKTVYYDAGLPFGIVPLGVGYIVTSNGCRYELNNGVVLNIEPCLPGGSCVAPTPTPTTSPTPTPTNTQTPTNS